MKNEYEVRGDVTAIFLKRRDGSTLETLIDTEDLHKAQAIKGSWSISFNKWCKGFYAKGYALDENGQKKRVSLHRRIISADHCFQVDHVNHDTLDNRKENLREVSVSVNQHNRLAPNVTNRSSGVLGVSWNKSNNKWEARVRNNNKRLHLGYFDTVAEAAKAVIAAREQIAKQVTF